MPHLLLAFSWILFCGLHSLLADTKVKARLNATLGRWSRYYRLFYTVFAFLSLAAVLGLQLSMDQLLLFSPGLVIKVLGGLISAGGLVLMGICIRKYFAGLSGIRSLYEEGAKQPLLITGVHRFLRHPLYLGTFAFIWGLWLLFPYASLLIANTVITLYTIWGIRLEEAKLVEEFGDDYRRYQQQVPRLLPRRRALG